MHEEPVNLSLFDMIRENPETKEFILMPMIFKIKGVYPKEYLEKD